MVLLLQTFRRKSISFFRFFVESGKVTVYPNGQRQERSKADRREPQSRAVRHEGRRMDPRCRNARPR